MNCTTRVGRVFFGGYHSTKKTNAVRKQDISANVLTQFATQYP